MPLRDALRGRERIAGHALDYFLLMSAARQDGTYSLKVYHDHTGELEFDGAVKVDGARGAPIAVNDGRTFNSWDGTRLSLMDGRTLSPVKK